MGPWQGHGGDMGLPSSVFIGPGQEDAAILGGSLLCWGLLPQAQGEAQHLLFLQISKDQLETGNM